MDIPCGISRSQYYFPLVYQEQMGYYEKCGPSPYYPGGGPSGPPGYPGGGSPNNGLPVYGEYGSHRGPSEQIVQAV